MIGLSTFAFFTAVCFFFLAALAFIVLIADAAYNYVRYRVGIDYLVGGSLAFLISSLLVWKTH